MDIETAERLSRLETQVDKLIEMVEENHKDLHEVKDQLTKWKGIAGGIAIAVSCMWAAGLGIVEWMKR
jgi:DNA-binding FrmR family transcriptional regulator